MKKILLAVVATAICFSVLAVKKNTTPANHHLPIAAVSIITDEPFRWTAADATATGYKKLPPAQNDQPVITQAQFKKDSTFCFVISKISDGGTQTETVVEGKVKFSKNEQQKNCLETKATKGFSKEIKNGKTTVLPVPVADLNSVYSANWRWEKISFPGIPSEDFLLLVNTDLHPSAARGIPGNINRSWLSKFYYRK